MSDAELELHRHSAVPFELPLPSGWERREDVEGCALVAVEPPREDPHFRASVVVTLEALAPGTSLDVWTDRSREALRESLNRLRVIDLEPMEIAGVPARRTLSHYVHERFGGINLEHFALVDRGLGYVVSCSCAALEYDDLADVQHRIAAGLRPVEAPA